jgi:hypothetical protein
VDFNTLKRRWRREIRAIISALVFAVTVAFVLRSWETAWVITLSLLFHELGHGLAVSRFGIDWELGFSPLGAWTKTPLKARRALNHFSNALIHLAGPFFSLLLALTCIIIYLFPLSINRGFWIGFANFNALICVLNLLPMGKLTDGGKFVRKLFSFTDETLVQRLLALVGVLPLAFLAAIIVYRLDWARLISLLTIVLWFVLTMLLESRFDDPNNSDFRKAMTSPQARDLLSGMILMLLIGMGIVTTTPFWLTAGHVVKMVAFFSFLVN